EEEEESRDSLKEAIEEELEAGEVGKPSFFYRQFLRNKDTSRDTSKYVPYPAISAVLRGV
ncbi:hypothetical protein L249_5422, partial [Ophiocordyceps polyrhachis-furcata BCC 54312]